MKLRQKLAMVLAAAMIVTAVPVTTMAASTNKLSKEVSLSEGTVVTTDAGVGLEITVDKVTSKGKVFYVNAQDFKFDKDAYAAYGDTVAGGVTVKYLKEGQLEVTITEPENASAKLYVPIFGTAEKGTPTIIVDGKDSDVTSGPYVLSGEVVTSETLAATAGDVKNISIDGEGEIADITISEKTVGALSGATVEITLPNRSDLDFVADINDIKVEGDRGLHALTTAKAIESVEYKIDKKDNEDEKVLVVTFKDFAEAEGITTTGSVTLKGISVQPENKREECKTGEVSVTVTGTKGDKEALAKTSLHVANVTDYGVKLEVVDEEVIELVAGRSGTNGTVKVNFSEMAMDSFDARKDVYFKVEGAVIDGAQEVTNGEKTDVEWIKGEVVAEFKHVVKNADGTETVKDSTTIEYLGDNEFVLEFGDISDDEINKFTIEIPLLAKVGSEGDITLVATSKGFEEEAVETVLGTVEAILTTESKEATVKVGLNGQKTGTIVIEENEAGAFDRGQEIQVVIPADVYEDGISIKGATVEIDGDIELEKIKVDEVALLDEDKEKTGEKEVVLTITVKRPSDEASTITISEIEFNVNRLTPEGKYTVKLAGDAICENGGRVDLENFIVIGTKNTEDLNDASKLNTVAVTANATQYVLNGETKEVAADLVAFNNADGRMMAPARLIGDAFGVQFQSGFANGVTTVTFFQGSKVVSFTNGSNMMVVNGNNVAMDTAAVIKNDRLFVPVRPLANALGIQVEYVNETQTATFTNEAK